MKRFLLLALAVSLNLQTSTTADEKAVEIPLKEIWALDMPGTRHIYKLEPEIFEQFRKLPSEEHKPLADKSLIFKFGETLDYLKADQEATQGFAVSGSGREALTNALQSRLKDGSPSSKFPANREITLIFFSHQLGRFVQLHEVKRHGDRIEVRYRLQPHSEPYLTGHFALIPLGKLPTGEYRVEIVRSPMEKKYLDRGSKESDPIRVAPSVCKPFTFEVIAE